MAYLYVTELGKMQQAPAVGHREESAQVAMLPSLAEQRINIGGTSAASAAFGSGTLLIRVHTDSICHITVGSNPTATNSMARMVAGQTEYFGVKAGDKIAVIAGT